jgi:hypothetical protein
LNQKPNAVLSKIYLRFHARIIVAIVAFSSFLISHSLLKYANLEILIRYPLSALGSYLVFLVLMHFWKSFLEDLPPLKPAPNNGTINIDRPEPPFKWHDYVDALDLSSGLEDFLISIAAIVVLIILFYSVGIVIFEIPILLTELVLSGFTTSVLFKSINTADKNIFVFKVFRQTVWSGLLIMFLYLLVAVIVIRICPTAIKLADLFAITCSTLQ